MAIQNRLTEMLRIEHPILLAPMDLVQVAGLGPLSAKLAAWPTGRWIR